MSIQGNRQRLLDGGFTERQVSAILDVLEAVTTQLVTREYLDRRLLEMSDHFDAVLDAKLGAGLRQTKRDLLLWLLAMLVVFVGPLYVILLTRSGA